MLILDFNYYCRNDVCDDWEINDRLRAIDYFIAWWYRREELMQNVRLIPFA